MRPCATCTHPDRAAIEAELLQAESLRTIAAHHGISPPALLRHRRRHMTEPSIGDILAPDDIGDFWRVWNGTQWQRIEAPRFEHLKEVLGRPSLPGAPAGVSTATLPSVERSTGAGGRELPPPRLRRFPGPACLLLGIEIPEQLEAVQTGFSEPLGAVAAVSQPTRAIFLGFLTIFIGWGATVTGDRLFHKRAICSEHVSRVQSTSSGRPVRSGPMPHLPVHPIVEHRSALNTFRASPGHFRGERSGRLGVLEVA